MPIGIFANVVAVATGGLIGAALAKRMSRELIERLTLVFGLCALANGVLSAVKATAMPAVVLSLIVGALIGEALQLERRVTAGFRFLLGRLPLDAEKLDMSFLVTVSVIFCASGFGMYGVFMEGMRGEHSILFSKAVLDIFSALIFAGTLGIVVSLIALPQLVIMSAFFFLARLIGPHIDAEQLANFMSCGGTITIAAGLTVCGIKRFSLVSLVPSLFVVMPLTWLYRQLL